MEPGTSPSLPSNARGRQSCATSVTLPSGPKGGLIPPMATKIRKRIGTGIYLLESGSIRAKVSVGDRSKGGPAKEKQFPPGTSINTVKRWRDEARAHLRRTAFTPAKGTLAADAEIYLARINVRYPGGRKADLGVWLPQFG